MVTMKKAFTVTEFLVSSTIAIIVLGFFVQQITFASKVHIDNNLMQSTHNEAQAIINLIGIDLRMIGNGLPFEVDNFNIGDSLLDENNASSVPDITYPIFTASDDQTIQYRLNETGTVYMTTATFSIGASNFYVTLHDVDGLFPGDPIYITNKSLAKQEGFWGEIKDDNTGVDVANKRVLIDVVNNGYWLSEVSGFAGFGIGSILEPVSDITLTNTVSGGVNTITRQINDSTPLELARNASFTARYYSYTQVGNAITLVEIPTITDDDLLDQSLNFIEITVNVTSEKNLAALGNVGTPYIASITQLFAIKNLRSKN